MSREQTPAADAELRMRAQDRLQQQGRALAARAGQADNPQRLVHELQVHQVELELQNEQLEAARAWIEAALVSYTELFDFAPVPYFTLDRAGKITELNLAAARLLGTERGRVTDKRLALFVAEPDRAALAACLKSLFSTQSDAQCEVVLVARDGARRTVEVRTTSSSNGETCRAVVIDVSQSRAREHHARQLGHVFSHALDAMFICDPQGLIADVNAAFSELTGYAPEDVAGQHQRLLRSEDQAQALDESIARALALHGSWRGEVDLRHRNGDLIRLTQQIDRLVDDRGAHSLAGRFLRPL